MSAQEWFDTFPDTIELNHNFRLQWSVTGVGFGESYFYVEDGVIKCSNECMGKDFLKKVLCMMVDQCELQEVPMTKHRDVKDE
jgi:hypothetical protein